MDTCSAVDVVDGTIYCCTLDAGHAGEHQSDYVTLDATGQVVQASYTWTATS